MCHSYEIRQNWPPSIPKLDLLGKVLAKSMIDVCGHLAFIQIVFHFLKLALITAIGWIDHWLSAKACDSVLTKQKFYNE